MTCFIFCIYYFFKINMKQITAKIMPNPHQVANLQKMFYILTNRGIRKVRKGKSEYLGMGKKGEATP